MNYYDILNIGRDADATAIKRAYFSAVKIHSPDRDPEGFKAIRLAYDTLSDKKKRIEYDSYFVLSGDLQNKLLAAREMIRDNKYKQAADFLTSLINASEESKKQPTLFPPEYPIELNIEAKRLLAEVLLYMKKSGTAKKICEQLLEKNPADADTLLLLAKISVSLRHTDKAGLYFHYAVNAAPENAKIWIEYMYWAIDHASEHIPAVFERAMKQDIDMFRDDYILYLICIYQLDLQSDENIQQYYNKFTDYFLMDKQYDEKIYYTLINVLPMLLARDEKCIPFAKKILPTLENSRFRKESDGEIFEAIHTTFNFFELKTDKRIHEVLVDMTLFFLMEQTDKDELLEMEYFIVTELFDLRKSVKVLKNEYPEFFELNKAFYLEILNEKKEIQLIEKYIGKISKLKPSSRASFYDGLDDELGDDDDEVFHDILSGESGPLGRPAQVVRASPKIGRNDPCPCGSGKKYKKCCGV